MSARGTQAARSALYAVACLLTLGLTACGADRPESDSVADTKPDTTTSPEKAARSREAAQALEPGVAPPAAGTRSEDDALSARVRTVLKGQPGLKTLSIDATAADGAVTLYGTASTPAQRELRAGSP
jgi:hypothetical protein